MLGCRPEGGGGGREKQEVIDENDPKI